MERSHTETQRFGEGRDRSDWLGGCLVRQYSRDWMKPL